MSDEQAKLLGRIRKLEAELESDELLVAGQYKKRIAELRDLLLEAWQAIGALHSDIAIGPCQEWAGIWLSQVDAALDRCNRE